MKTRFSLASEYRYADVGAEYMRVARPLVDRYERIYESMRATHPQYSHGWHASFTAEHRFMNRVVMQLIADGIIAPESVILDIGCYDAMLPAVLRVNGYNAWGLNADPWDAMWKELAVLRYVNATWHPHIDVAVMLNYCHNWRPEEIEDVVTQKCANRPSLILMDREARTPHRNNTYWMDDALLATIGIEVVKLPLCRQSIESDRDLLVMELK